ncbi:MAG: hypothetical protein WAO76_00400 [Georgfuchsia sp.]
MLNEVPRTSGDIRRLIAESMQEVRNGSMDTAKAQAIAALAKELTASMQAEVNVAKVNMLLRKEGMAFQNLRHMGKMLIGDDSTPTLNGKDES